MLNKTKIVIAAVVLAGLGFFYLQSGTKEQKIGTKIIPAVKVQTVENSAQASDRVYSGVVKPRFESQLAFQVGGKVSERLVDRGVPVKKGQLLMKLDPKDVHLNLQSAQAAFDKVVSDKNLAQTNLVRYKNLFDQNAVSKSQLDEIQNHYNTAEASVRNAQSNLEEAKRRVGYTELHAEHDGVIVEKKAEVDQVVTAGQTVLVLQQGTEMDVEISVPEQRVGDFRNNPNIEANVVIPAIAEKEYSLAVREVAPQADPTTRTYNVKFSFIEEPAGLTSGMTAAVDVIWRGEKPPILIPLPALYRTQGQPDSVWIFKDNKVSKRAVEIGSFAKNEVDVISGLSVGEEIVVAGVQKLEEGQEVKKWTGTAE